MGAAPLVTASTEPRSATKATGRPPKDYWEDVIIAMMVRWAEGDIKPKRQSEVAEAMKDWLDARSEKWSETTIKERAKKVFNAIQVAESKQ